MLSSIKKADRAARRSGLGFYLHGQEPKEGFGLTLPQHRRLARYHREIPRRQEIEAVEPARRLGLKEALECSACLVPVHRLERHFEQKAPHGGGVETLDEVRRAGERVLSSLHVPEHLVDLANLPAGPGGGAVA